MSWSSPQISCSDGGNGPMRAIDLHQSCSVSSRAYSTRIAISSGVAEKSNGLPALRLLGGLPPRLGQPLHHGDALWRPCGSVIPRAAAAASSEAGQRARESGGLSAAPPGDRNGREAVARR